MHILFFRLSNTLCSPARHSHLLNLLHVKLSHLPACDVFLVMPLVFVSILGCRMAVLAHIQSVCVLGRFLCSEFYALAYKCVSVCACMCVCVRDGCGR